MRKFHFEDEKDAKRTLLFLRDVQNDLLSRAYFGMCSQQMEEKFGIAMDAIGYIMDAISEEYGFPVMSQQ